MPEYRRANIPGALYFFTLVTYERKPFLTDSHAPRCLRTAFDRVRSKHPFEIEASVLLPDHLHIVWRLPENDSDFAGRWSEIKSMFTRQYLMAQEEPGIPSKSRNRKRERGVWQRRYWEHLIRDENDFRRHLDYIHFNPVKHGYVAAPKEWEWSSFRWYVDKGWYDIGWGDCRPDGLLETCVGEPGGKM